MKCLLLGLLVIIGYSTTSHAKELDGIVYTGTDSIVITDYTGAATSLDLSEYFQEATKVTIKDWAFAGTTITSIVLPENIVSIGESAFDGSSIQTISFSSNTKSLVLGKNVFKDCANLTELDIPNCVTLIPEGLCYDCTSLLNVTLPEACTFIGQSAFYNCNSLAGVAIPASCTFISSSAFCYCKQLQSVTFGETENSDKTLILGTKAFENCDALTTISIPEGCTSIPANAFWSCDSLRSVTIPESCTSISDNVFAYCKSLSQINSSNVQEAILPQNCTSIGANAFQDCTSLKNIEIPKTCTSVGAEAFAGCTGLNQVVFANENTSIGEEAFPDTQQAPNIVIYCMNVGSVTIYADSANLACESIVQMISITSLPNVREYMYSDNGKLDLTGLAVKASVMSLSAETGYENKVVSLGDCIISGFDSTQAGKQNITITYGGKQASFDVKVYYDINNTTVTVQSATYTGNAVVPSFVVYGKDTEQALVCETDYLYTCQDNIKVGDEAKLTLIGIGVYKGEKTVAFSIVPNEKLEEKNDNEDSEDVNTGESNDANNGGTSSDGGSSEGIESSSSNNVEQSTTSKVKEKPKKGKTYTYKNLVYKVTGSNTVTFMKPVNKKTKKIIIPSKVKILGKSFKVTKINKKACCNCKKLTTVIIGNNVVTIGDQAFARCSKLNKVTIGKGLKKIGKKVFYKDGKLKLLIIKSSKLTSVGRGTLKGVTGLSIKAPKKKVKKYDDFFKKSK